VSGRLFTGEALREVAFPLGGIGTGTVSLGGRGELRDWEIFNRPSKGSVLPHTFFALRAAEAGRAPVSRVLERRFLPPYGGQYGLPAWRSSGMPRLAEAAFEGAYPLARVAFADDALPVRLGLTAFNPMIPHEADDSGLPVAYFLWRLTNTAARPVDATLALSLLNAVGYDAQSPFLRGRRLPLFGGNLNTWRDEAGLRGIAMTRVGGDAAAPGAGSLAIATTWPETTYTVHWERSGWFSDELESFWRDLEEDGRLRDDPTSDPSPAGQTDVGSLGLVARLDPGEEVELPFVLGWHFPNLVNYWNGNQPVLGARVGNYYTTRFADAWDAARYAAEHRERLEAGTRLFQETLFASTLPEPVLDAVSSQMSILRTTTCLRTQDGRFHAFEGCRDDSGCCPMDCTHVWNYEQTLAHLYPALERSMRLTDFEHNLRTTGLMASRTLLPLTDGLLQETQAADGQMGCVLKLYREWRLSGDDAFLRRLWPLARRALEYAWRTWDPERTGVMSGEQHTTYDVELYGPNTFVGALYLGALKAAAAMARHLGEGERAAEYDRVYARGRDRIEAELWNGEYYQQRVVWPQPSSVPPTRPAQAIYPGDEVARYQYGRGCLADHLLGQWFSHVVGLGHLLPEEHVRSAVAAIYRHNWRSTLGEHRSCQRTYALDDEAGLLVCTWPNGGRPRYPLPYGDECWTGTEYQVAAHLIYEGLVDEGLAIVAGVRARHDGARRNPWDEVECGHHYARALSSWSLLLAFSGYQYSAPDRFLGFRPRSDGDFACFFSTGECWGLYRRHGNGAAIEVRHGTLALRAVDLGLPVGGPLRARGPAGALEARVAQVGGRLPLELAAELVLRSGDTLTVTAGPA
jgi:non-lysosomal glucosylceramidase